MTKHADKKSKKPKKSKTRSQSLPRWDLTHLYRDPSDPAIVRDTQWLSKAVADFVQIYEGKLSKATPQTLAASIKSYEAIEDRAGKLMCYAQLLYSTAMNRADVTQFYQNTQEKLTKILSKLVFYTLEINRIDDKKLAAAIRDNPTLAHYKPWLDKVRSYKPYQLSHALEEYIHETSVTLDAWQRLFDETCARLRFHVGGKTLTEAEAIDLLSHKNAKKRKKAAHEFARVFAKNAPLFTHITNTLAKAKEIEDTKRGFALPISERNVENQVEDEVVEALIATVKRNYGTLSHRYYQWKAKQFGKKQLHYWDRNAPFPKAADTSIPWNEAVNIVLTSYAEFSPELAAIGQRFFKERWIDVPPQEGKDSGAFSHPVVPSAHPYILMNYQGKVRDVMTLAHELGHGVHQVLSAEQGALMADTPLTLAETASVFGEMLTFQSLLKREKNKKRRKLIIAAKVEDMLNTVVRQIAFCEFERLVHGERRQGELSTERIGKLWMQVQRESLGKGITLAPEYEVYWMYISHFIHAPFYVYAYAFGDCLVNSLYGVYLKEAKAGRAQAFVKKYIAMLQAGGTQRHTQLLAPFGLDARRADFWQTGLDVIGSYIDELTA